MRYDQLDLLYGDCYFFTDRLPLSSIVVRDGDSNWNLVIYGGFELDWIECAVTLGGQSIPALFFLTLAEFVAESQVLYLKTAGCDQDHIPFNSEYATSPHPRHRCLNRDPG
jgi:hypothetical protein